MGKITLIKSVVQAIFTYCMVTFRILEQVCEDMDAIIQRFWSETKGDEKCYLALRK